MSLSLSPCITFSAPSVYGFRSFLALHVSSFKHLIKLSLDPHHVLELTATLLLSVTFPCVLGIRKGEPIFVADLFLFPFVSFFSSVTSLRRVICDSQDLFPFLTVAGLLLLYLFLLTICSLFFLLLSHFFQPWPKHCLCPTTGAQSLEICRLQIQRPRVRSPALPDFLSSSGSGTGSTQPREVNWGVTWMKKVEAPGLENRD